FALYTRYADLTIKGHGLNLEQACQAVIDGLPQ
ncbi:MAG TPA: shikimate kinase, partial [Marinobacter hydrocarbonoclasticus]|nr:shikimate kinase [Marinobacter nauticus]